MAGKLFFKQKHSGIKLHYRRIYTLITFLIAISIMFSGCVRPEEQGFQADAPIYLKPAARNLLNAQSQDLVVETKKTAADIPLTTQLVRHVAEKSQDAVVSIFVKTRTPYRLKLIPFGPFGGIPIKVAGIGLGSGFFIHPSGYLLTNNHVIEHAQKIRIMTSDGSDYGVTVIARDPAYDLALLQADVPGGVEFKALPMGNSDAIGAGDMVIAIGNPLGLGHTVTSGIISQTYRTLTGTTEHGRHIDLLQTDTAINPGSSGGPLITLTGAWIGVNTAAATGAQGIGFAVPSSHVLEFLEDIREGTGVSEQ